MPFWNTFPCDTAALLLPPPPLSCCFLVRFLADDPASEFGELGGESFIIGWAPIVFEAIDVGPLICDMDGEGDGVSRVVFVVVTESPACGSYEIFKPPPPLLLLLLPPLTPPPAPPPNELKSGVLEEVTKDEKGAAEEEVEEPAAVAVTTPDADLNGWPRLAEACTPPDTCANKLDGLGLLLVLSRSCPPALLLVTTP